MQPTILLIYAYKYVHMQAAANDTVVCGRKISKLRLATALIQPTPSAMALKLMSCIFTKQELTNGTPSGTTTSKDERRVKTVQKLDPSVMQYIEGINDNTATANHNNYIIFYSIQRNWNLSGLEVINPYKDKYRRSVSMPTGTTQV